MVNAVRSAHRSSAVLAPGGSWRLVKGDRGLPPLAANLREAAMLHAGAFAVLGEGHTLNQKWMNHNLQTLIMKHVAAIFIFGKFAFRTCFVYYRM